MQKPRQYWHGVVLTASVLLCMCRGGMAGDYVFAVRGDRTFLNGREIVVKGLASTWLQCVAPPGPNHRPGGDGTPGEPGIKWWLEFLRAEYGAYAPSSTGTT